MAKRNSIGLWFVCLRLLVCEIVLTPWSIDLLFPWPILGTLHASWAVSAPRLFRRYVDTLAIVSLLLTRQRGSVFIRKRRYVLT